MNSRRCNPWLIGFHEATPQGLNIKRRFLYSGYLNLIEFKIGWLGNMNGIKN